MRDSTWRRKLTWEGEIENQKKGKKEKKTKLQIQPTDRHLTRIRNEASPSADI
jgi:hypothetical protein